MDAVIGRISFNKNLVHVNCSLIKNNLLFFREKKNFKICQTNVLIESIFFFVFVMKTIFFLFFFFLIKLSCL